MYVLDGSYFMCDTRLFQERFEFPPTFFAANIWSHSKNWTTIFSAVFLLFGDPRLNYFNVDISPPTPVIVSIEIVMFRV